jgi:hypothetical protein
MQSHPPCGQTEQVMKSSPARLQYWEGPVQSLFMLHGSPQHSAISSSASEVEERFTH